MLLAWRAGLLRGAARADPRQVLVEVSLAAALSPARAPVTPQPPDAPKRRARIRRASPTSRAAASLPAEPAPPEEASAARPSEAGAPLDLTGDLLVVASAGRPGGGSGEGRAGANGIGPGAGDGRSAGSPATAAAGDRSGGVSLEHHDWACPWPHEADDQQIDAQTVVITVVVGPDGRVESATLVSDPGHGFGTAAIACALHARFTPARDREGRPTRATSPAVLVRFTR